MKTYTQRMKCVTGKQDELHNFNSESCLTLTVKPYFKKSESCNGASSVTTTHSNHSLGEQF